MWKLITGNSPSQKVLVKTKIDDYNGVRNEQNLIRDGKLWWTSDHKMYVYYTPTHWWDAGTIINQSK